MEEWTTETTPKRLREILGAIRKTQVQLARVIGVTDVTVSRWVNGRNTPDPRSRKFLERIEERYVKKGH